MAGENVHAEKLKHVEAYGELAIHCMWKNPVTDPSPVGLRLELMSLRDLLIDAADVPGADHALGRAYLAARHRAQQAGEDVATWPWACPWRVVDLVEAMNRRIAQLDIVGAAEQSRARASAGRHDRRKRARAATGTRPPSRRERSR